MRVVVALIAFVCLLSSPAWAQEADPYERDYRKELVQQYKAERDAIYEEVEILYSAVQCKVFSDSGETTPYIMARVREFNARYLPEFARRGYQLPGGLINVEAAAQRGFARGREPGACDYFRDHPDVVVDLRRLSGQASGISSRMHP